MAPLFRLIITEFARSITSLMFLLILMLAYAQIKRTGLLEESWLGRRRETVSNQFMNVVLYGMIVGLIASFLIVIIGITLDMNTILFIWPLALFLMLINQRYLCFSYAGGILALISLIFDWPSIDVSAIIALVGILHLMESLLILMDGSRSSLPVIMEHKRFKPIGAFVLNRMWPIPLLMLVVPSTLFQASGGGVAMPDWWPLFQAPGGEGGLMIIPLAAVLGYGDIAVTRTPRQRTLDSGLWLGAYSALIITLAILSTQIYWLKYAAAVLMPALHEILIFLGKKSQMEGKPMYGAPWRGLRILDVFPEGVGAVMGLQPGDILLRINNRDINSAEMLSEVLGAAPGFVWLEVSRRKETLTFEHKNYQNGISTLDILPVPRQAGRTFLFEEQQGLAVRLIKKITRRLQDKKTTSG